MRTSFVVPRGRTVTSLAHGHPAEPSAGDVVHRYTVFCMSEAPENLKRSRHLILALPIDSYSIMSCVTESAGIGAAVTTTYMEALPEVLESLETTRENVRGTVDAARTPLLIVIVGVEVKGRTVLSTAEVQGDTYPPDTLEQVQAYVKPWFAVATSGSRESEPSMTRSLEDLTSCELPPEIKAEIGEERTLMWKVMKDDAFVA